MAVPIAPPGSPHDGAMSTVPLTQPGPGPARLAPFVMMLFFIFGGITSLNDVLVPKLKDLFTLSYMQALLVQSAFFAAYFIISVPAAVIVTRVGYMRGAVIGLMVMMVGCLLFIPASAGAAFTLFLFALFVLAAGVTIVQVVANPLISILGPPATAHSRLTFAQAFNSLGTTIFPYAGSLLILGGLAQLHAADLSGAALAAYRTAETRVIANAYLGLTAALAIVAAVVWSQRKRLGESRNETVRVLDGFALLKRPRFAFGTACLFLYVGAEVTIGSLIISHLRQPQVMNLDARHAGTLVAFYWGGALVGRFAGSAVLRLAGPGKVLAFNAVGAIVLLALAANLTGAAAGYSILAVGLMNSIMFPTIFSLACEGLGDRTAQGSGVICMAIVGGAIVPPLTGHVADVTGSLSFALLLPAICYAVIALFGIYAARPLISARLFPQR